MKGFGDLYKDEKKKNKPPTEKIINQAIQLHLQGNIKEAKKFYKQLISQECNDHRVFSNYGAILQGLGKLEEAELSYRQAIQLNPNYAEAHSNLGNILRDLGKLKEAELSTRKAIQLNPNFANAHYNLGIILSDHGKLKEAELSTRKAIQLKPDFADANNNLGDILIYLGNLKELILISKKTLESKLITKEYKLRASLLITIANLLQGDFAETFLNLNKTKELISRDAIYSITDKKIRKHTFTFFKFINSLYPLLEKENNNYDSKIIPYFGESHCLSFAHQTTSISSQLNQLQPVLITGGKAWHFANNDNNQWKDSLNQQIKNHTYSDKAFISFGEIDCRKDEGILNYSLKSGRDILEICEEIIREYVLYMEGIFSPNYSERYYFGVPAPTRRKKLLDHLDIKRIKLIKLYNSILKKEVLSSGSYFLDVYKLTSNNDGLNNNIHMCDRTHLSPKCLSVLFKNYLHKGKKKSNYE